VPLRVSFYVLSPLSIPILIFLSCFFSLYLFYNYIKHVSSYYYKVISAYFCKWQNNKNESDSYRMIYDKENEIRELLALPIPIFSAASRTKLAGRTALGE
jgi:hypothetical protein